MSGMSSRATKGNVTKMVASTMPGTAKMILMSCSCSHGAEPALRAEEQHVDQAGDDGRNREGQVDERDQQALAAEIRTSRCPGRGDAEDEIQRHGDGGGDERELDRREGIGFVEARRSRRRSPCEGLGEDRDQRQQEEEREEEQRDGDEQRAHPGAARVSARWTRGAACGGDAW